MSQQGHSLPLLVGQCSSCPSPSFLSKSFLPNPLPRMVLFSLFFLPFLSFSSILNAGRDALLGAYVCEAALRMICFETRV